jgi:hypothetical protein
MEFSDSLVFEVLDDIEDMQVVLRRLLVTARHQQPSH